jgi:hypothetical protein
MASRHSAWVLRVTYREGPRKGTGGILTRASAAIKADSAGIICFHLRRLPIIGSLEWESCPISASALIQFQAMRRTNGGPSRSVWTCNYVSAEEMERILIKHERQMTSLADDIARIDGNGYTGVDVIKIHLHEGADVTGAVSELASSAQTVRKSILHNIMCRWIMCRWSLLRHHLLATHGHDTCFDQNSNA